MADPANPAAPASSGGEPWRIVVPAKALDRAKSRMTAELSDPARRELVSAMLADVLTAAGRCPRVGARAVVTGDPVLAGLAASLGAAVIAEPTAGGPVSTIAAGGDVTYRRAAAAGIAWAQRAHAQGGIAVLAADLPGLDTNELSSALDLAAHVPRGIVVDADGSGTTMATFGIAQNGRTADRRTWFGPGSAAEFLAAGATALGAPEEWPGLRRDVDLLRHLGELPRLGERTTALSTVRLNARGPHERLCGTLGKLEG